LTLPHDFSHQDLGGYFNRGVGYAGDGVAAQILGKLELVFDSFSEVALTHIFAKCHG